MTRSRQADLRAMLETRREVIEEQVQQKLRDLRDTASVETTRSTADESDESADLDLDVELVQMRAQTLENITAALARLSAGDYGFCHDCEAEIPAKRLRALPFATRCMPCQEEADRVVVRERRLGRRHAGFRDHRTADGLDW